MKNRREFLGVLGATAAVAAVRPSLASDVSLGKERMRLGVLADIHISDETQQPYFEKALRAFDDWGCDGVLACGDIADHGIGQQLELAAQTWFKVFPDGKGRGGRPVANLLHYGDHDMADWYLDRPEAKKLLTGQDVEASVISHGENRGRIWEKCFKEKYEPITVKTVKGYTFVLYHFNRHTPGNGNDVPGLEEVFAKLKVDPAKPFFFSQHRAIRETHYLSSGDNGDTTRLFSKYPNLVAFTGHCHISATEERSVWQGAFTSVQVPSLRYSWTRGGRENSYSSLDRPPIPPFKTMGEMSTHDGSNHQGLFCTIHDNAIVIKRWNFSNDSSLGADWVIPFSSFALPPEQKPFAFARRAQTVGIPQFAPNADVKVLFKQGKDRGGNARQLFTVQFPPAKASGGRPAANDYSVRLEAKQDELERILLEKRVYGRQYVTGAGDDSPVVCPFSEEEVPKGWLLRFSVRPLNTFDGAGEAIATPWEYRSWGKNPKQAAAEAKAYVAGFRKKK